MLYVYVNIWLCIHFVNLNKFIIMFDLLQNTEQWVEIIAKYPVRI